MLSRDLRVLLHKAAGAYKRPSSTDMVGSQSKRAFGLGVNVSSGSLNCITWLDCPITDLEPTDLSSQGYPQVGSFGCGENRATAENSTRQISGSMTMQCTKELPWNVQMPSLSLSAAKSQPSTLSEEQRARIERNRRAALERRQARMNQPAVR